jgi:hypothetical protein
MKLIMIRALRVVNFATSGDVVVRSTKFPHQNIYKYNCTSPEGNAYNQINHVLIDRKR